MPWQKTPDDRRRDAANYGPEYRRNAATIKRQANGRCMRCGQLTRQLQADHITPVSAGGGHDLSNLQALCPKCHAAKTAREGGGWRKPPVPADPPAQPTTKW